MNKELKEKEKLENAVSNDYYKLKMTAKDWIIVSVMMIIYSIIAFIRLGSTVMPQTYWTTDKVNQYFVVDFGEEVELSRINMFCGVKDEGKINALYYDAEKNDYSQIYKINHDVDGNITTRTRFVDKNDGVFKIWSLDCRTYDDTVVKTRYVKFIATRPSLQIGEIAFYIGDAKVSCSNFKIVENTIGDEVNYLFDEQSKIEYSYDVMNSTYFDEVYHGRTGVEHMEGIRPYEWTHPPLGKILIALGMKVFGKNMFGMRSMGTIFGIFMILLMYMFGKKVVKTSFGGFAAAFLMMFDFMHFTHSRISSIDVYAVTFVILMFYFMYDYYVAKAHNMGLKKTLTDLFLSGLFMGCAVSVKWNTAYGALGLAVIFFWALANETKDCITLYKNKLSDKYSWTKRFESDYVVKVIIFCVFSFIVVPATVYMATFIPYTMVTDGNPYTFKDVIDLQTRIYNYHSKLTATHNFQSAWYTWPITARPLWMYASADDPSGIRGIIVTMGNPAVWWGGVVAFIFAIAIAFKKRDKRMIPIFVAIASLLLPWALVTRCTFIYHYFPVLPFVMICTAYVLNYLRTKTRRGKYYIAAYFAVAVLLFAVFYPVLTGLKVSKTYISVFTQWFPSWVINV